MEFNKRRDKPWIKKIERNMIGGGVRLPGLDLLRIIAALGIFLFHSYLHIDCNYGVLNYFIRNGAIFMVAFFFLSGYLLYYTNQEKDFAEWTQMKIFYEKRILAIFPLYIVVAVLYEVFISRLHFRQVLILLPIELTLTQSWFSSLFSLTHNGGTWFFSCLMLGYLIFPFFVIIIRQIDKREHVILFLFCYLIASYAPFVHHEFLDSVDVVYSNPLFRCLEFAGGVTCGSFVCNQFKYKAKNNLLKAVISFMFLFLGVSILGKLGLNYTYQTFFVFPVFACMIYYLSFISVKSKIIQKGITFFSGISFEFFMAQFFVWDLVRFTETIIELDNVSRIVISFAICICIAIGLHKLVTIPSVRLYWKIRELCSNKQ